MTFRRFRHERIERFVTKVDGTMHVYERVELIPEHAEGRDGLVKWCRCRWYGRIRIFGSDAISKLEMLRIGDTPF
jgi:hypothetical protein